MTDFQKQIENGQLPFKKEMKRLAQRILGSDWDVEDVLQNVQMAVWMHIAIGGEVANPKQWLSKAVRTSAQSMLRAARRRRQVPIEAAEHVEAPAFAESYDVAKVDVATAGMNEQVRLVARTVVQEGSIPLAAAALGMTEKMVQSLLAEVVEELNGKRSKGQDSTAGGPRSYKTGSAASFSPPQEPWECAADADYAAGASA